MEHLCLGNQTAAKTHNITVRVSSGRSKGPSTSLKSHYNSLRTICGPIYKVS